MLGALVVSGPAAAASSPETQLAQKYAPVVRLVTDAYGCENGDAFVPIDVDVLFGNDQVVLRGPWDRVNVAKIAPTVSDISSGLVDYHLDFPGDALNPGCTYANWAKRLNEKGSPTVYAHVAKERAYPSKLALQYWFFYIFNDFNNLHEGDWEMIQLNFDAPTAAQALTQQPTEVGYSQHEGAEKAAWDEAKLEKVDSTHPVVYPAAGSHANFFSEGLFLGRSAAQGVGCDDTEGTHEQISPHVAVVPTGTAAYLHAYPWSASRGDGASCGPRSSTGRPART